MDVSLYRIAAPKSIIFFSLISMLVFGCKVQEAEQELNDFTVNVRLVEDPERINPNLSRNSSAKQVENLLFLPMAEYHPQTFDLTPVLAESVPTLTFDEDGNGIYFDLIIKEDAVWDDGEPITGHDYSFTVKAILNPKTQAAGLRSFFLDVTDVEINESNPKQFRVRMRENNILATTIATNFMILPAHIYDPATLISDIPFEAFTSENESDTTFMAQFEQFALDFNNAKFSRDVVSGAGPYKLVNWESNQALQLERKEDWWGEKYADIIPNFKANPKKINYLIIADQQIAISGLKDGQIDIMGAVTPRTYFELKDDPSVQEILNFETASLFQFYYIVMNTREPILQDKRVRRALAHLMDVDQLNRDQMNNIGMRTVGPIHPKKPYYNSDLAPIAFDLERAKTLLDEAGWKDTDENGIRDKMIGGTKHELNLNFLITNQELGKAISLILHENGQKVGIGFETQAMEFSLILQAMDKGDFHMTPLRIRSGTQPDDLYSGWHRSGIRAGGRNFSGFGTEESDTLIEEIRETMDQSERADKYLRMQEIIYEEQPGIFLFCPSDCVISNKRFEITTTSRRPGYFANEFELAKIEAK